MKNVLIVFLSVVILTGFTLSTAVAQTEEKGIFDSIYDSVQPKEGVKEITYDEFLSIRNSGEKYVLIDVLSPDSYASGHIPGAISMPLDTITPENAAKVLNKEDNIIVYCGSFTCHASTAAAKKLSEMGYSVLDYKGGLKEWQEKGSKLVK